MERRKLTKEDIDKVRNIEGFPIAKDEDIIALSDAPYYTACPNPFIADFIKENCTPYNEETDSYKREPFSADVSEGKNDPIYMAHSYHTKVPHQAIMKYIKHYTNPGDVIFDGFCGTGMTGVAAQKIDDEEQLTHNYLDEEYQYYGRKAILVDLSPIATFISSNYNDHTDLFEIREIANQILVDCQKQFSWCYETNHSGAYGLRKGHVNYIAWSQKAVCPHCGKEVVLYDVLWNPDTKKMSDKFYCPDCNSYLDKNDCARSIETVIDDFTGQLHEQKAWVPVLINYSIGTKRFEKKPDKEDLEIIDKIQNTKITDFVPTNSMLGKGEMWGETWRSGTHFGITNIHHFYRKRTLLILSYMYSRCKENNRLLFWFTSCLPKLSIMNRYMPQHGSRALVGPMSGTLYVAPMGVENNVIDQFEFQLNKILKVNCPGKDVIVSTQSLTDLSNFLPNSIDYIFTDPPFGGNLMYSELSTIWESWLKVWTNNNDEAIVNTAQGKSTVEYASLMTECFKQYFSVLKPNRWITIEFHNSQNSVWYAIQQALSVAGFVIADVRVLDKQKGTIQQLTNTTSVQQDLVISAYKPSKGFISKLSEKAGTEETVWDFISQHLEKLPIVVVKNNCIEIIQERQAILLFDRMVAYHVLNGIPVPIDAADFYCGLEKRYLLRDGMYFLPNQVNEYDTARITNDIEPIQFSMLVSNEKSAIAWLYQQLSTPQTYAEIQPKFMQETKAIDKYEVIPELSVLLEENFLQDDKGRWYVPDVTKEADVQKLREKNLLKEFEGYLATKGKLKLFRTEAIRVGFAKLWKDKNYKLIVETAERLPEQIIQEDDKLLMYYDISLGRV